MERRYGYGVTLVIIGGLFLSTSGILLRNIEAASGWQILFYRGFTFSLTLFLLLLVRYRTGIGAAFRAVGKPGLWAALVLGLGSICYIFAILLTTVANAVFIIGAAPLATAFVAWLVLGEKTSRFGIIAMLVSLVGIGLMFADGLLEGRWAGNVAALGVVASFVVFLLIIRWSCGVFRRIFRYFKPRSRQRDRHGLSAIWYRFLVFYRCLALYHGFRSRIVFPDGIDSRAYLGLGRRW